MRLVATGDLILSQEAPALLSAIQRVFQQADFVVGHLEVPYTRRHPEALRLGRVPEALDALRKAGLHLVTLAGNHLMDYGLAGLEDTIRGLEARGIRWAGAGFCESEARRAGVLERDGVRVGVLSYNCVGPRETWAGRNRPGCAFVRVITHYELDHANPGGPPEVYTWAEPKTLREMSNDIQRARAQCDLVVVALHKGICHVPVTLADYEQQVARAAVDAGADVVISHHAHILKGIEVYRGKVIFHGLGNGAVHLPASAFDSEALPEAWAERRRRLFGFEPDPSYPTYPFHPEARYTGMAQVILEDGKLSKVGFVPCVVQSDGVPRPAEGQEGLKVYQYLRRISEDAGLNAIWRWQDGEVWLE